jgi:hypothetical protein
MSRFNAPRPTFGRNPTADAFPAPIIGKAAARRTASLGQAAEVLAVLPGPGETLHALMTGRYDLMHLITALVTQLGDVEAVRIATLSYNGRNLAEMVALLDSGAVKSLTLLCSVFFRDHNRELWDETLEEFRERGQRAAAARNHAKVVTFSTISGRRLSLEGSANLRTNSNIEQFALTDDASIHDWHAQFIDAQVSRHEGDEPDHSAAD